MPDYTLLDHAARLRVASLRITDWRFLVLLASVGAATLAVGIHTAAQAEHDALVIDVAGRQRMLTQRLTAEHLMIRLGQAVPDETGRGVARLFEESLAALMDGGAVSSGSRTVSLPRAASRDFRLALDEVGRSWADLRGASNAWMSDLRPATESLSAAAAFTAASGRTLALTDRAVQVYEREATARATRLRSMQMVLVPLWLAMLATGLVGERRAREADRTELVNTETVRESTRMLIESQRLARIASYRLDVVSGTWTSTEVLDEIFGIADPEFLRDVPGWLSIVHPDQRAEMAAYFAEEVLGNRQRFDKEYRIVRLNDGMERWVHELGELVADREGRLVEMIGTIQDITERKRLENQFHQAQKMESVGRLAGGVAHDFNNLLTVILGETELALFELPEDDSRRPGLSEVVKAAKRAEGLTRQLLAFSRQQVVECTTFNLNDLVADVDKMLQRLIGEDIDLVSPLAADLGAVKADRGQIEQVVMNLAVNARDAMPDGGKLTIETANVTLDEDYVRSHPYVRPGEYVLLTVSDSGVGMSEEIRTRIFEPFFTTKERDKGTGLGLATCYGIVKQADGHIVVYSEVGLGTTMKVYLPRVGQATEAPSLPAERVAERGSETILLVEDEEAVRRIAARILTARGYQMLVASSGEEALQLLESANHVHLLLTDVVLPGMNGKVLAERVQALRPDVKVLYTSGYTSDVALRHRLLEHGASLVQKPFTAAGLGRKVRETLDQATPVRS